MTSQRKAVALISGGLDSMLAAKAMLDQGIHVEGINFYTGFCVEGHTHAIRKQDQKKVKRNNALWTAEQLGIKLHIIDVIDDYKDVLINPKHGYGANMNPCLDCKVFMVKKAHEWMLENDFDFIVTGEVVGQRPMSQRRDTMNTVQKETQVGNLLVRPLCVQNLPATLPEREGWIKRDELFNFSGRSRKPQIALAEKYGFDDYAQPAGGCCFLTNEHYSKKLIDLWQFRGDKSYDLEDILMLKIGRHIRPRPNFKLIVGREEGENKFMEGYRKQFPYFFCQSHAGPLALCYGEKMSQEDIEIAARVVARFGQGKTAEEVTVIFNPPGEEPQTLKVKPFRVTEIPGEWYV